LNVPFLNPKSSVSTTLSNPLPTTNRPTKSTNKISPKPTKVTKINYQPSLLNEPIPSFQTISATPSLIDATITLSEDNLTSKSSSSLSPFAIFGILICLVVFGAMMFNYVRVRNQKNDISNKAKDVDDPIETGQHLIEYDTSSQNTSLPSTPVGSATTKSISLTPDKATKLPTFIITMLIGTR
jgi:hypothetical protein